MMGQQQQQQNPMMNRGGVFSQQQRFPMAQRPMNQFQAQMSNAYMGPQGQPGFGPNMPPFIPAGGINMMQQQQQMAFNQQQQQGLLQPGQIGPKIMSQSASVAPNPALMSEAEFYSYKEKLKREAEQKIPPGSTSGGGYRSSATSSRYRRHHRTRSRSRSYTSRSRSYSGSRSKSRSRSPRRTERNRSRNRSYSYSR